MLQRIIHITLFLTLPLFAQVNNGSLLYDIGIMIDDSTAVEETLESPELNPLERTPMQADLEEKLIRYQQLLAETEIRLRRQMQISDSLQSEIDLIKAASATDLALMSTKINTLEGEREKAKQPSTFIGGAGEKSDSVFAELHRPWQNVAVNTQPIQLSVSGPRLTPAEEQQAYRLGLTKFHQEFYYQAMDEFNTIVQRGSNMTLRANSQYWVGRCYYEKGLYDEAITALEQVQRFEESDKHDDALVMIGLAFKNKNRMAEAKLAFQELVTRHPGSEYLTLARRFVQE